MTHKASPTPALTDPMLKMHKDLLDAYDHASRVWLARVKSEVDLWSDVAAKLAASRSVPDALQAYQRCVVQRMQLATEDGRQMFDECQRITRQITRSMTNGANGAGRE
jgi:hypothetical protein